jgi:hypothetical protein
MWCISTSSETEGEESSDEAEVEEEETEEEAPKKKTEKVEKTVWDWELINANKPIWTRNPKDITEDDYNNFYKSFAREEKVVFDAIEWACLHIVVLMKACYDSWCVVEPHSLSIGEPSMATFENEISSSFPAV